MCVCVCVCGSAVLGFISGVIREKMELRSKMLVLVFMCVCVCVCVFSCLSLDFWEITDMASYSGKQLFPPAKVQML